MFEIDSTKANRSQELSYGEIGDLLYQQLEISFVSDEEPNRDFCQEETMASISFRHKPEN